MKSIMFCLVLFTISVTVDLPDMTGITTALKAGNAEDLSSFFSSDVELAILDDEDLYSKNEAKELVGAFFTENPPASFSQVHKGTSKGEDSHYVIGDLVAGSKTYRIYIYLKEVDDKYQIQELRIEE